MKAETDILKAMARKGAQVQRFQVYVWRHRQPFTPNGHEPESITIDVEAEVTHYAKDGRDGKRGEPFRAYIMGTKVKPIPQRLTRNQQASFRRAQTKAIAKYLSIDKHRVSYPATEPAVRFKPHPVDWPAGGQRCRRVNCGGVLYPNDDGDLRCILCGRGAQCTQP